MNNKLLNQTILRDSCILGDWNFVGIVINHFDYVY